MEVPQKVENITTIWSSNPTFGYIYKRNKIKLREICALSCSLQHYSQQPQYDHNVSVCWLSQDCSTWTCTLFEKSLLRNPWGIFSGPLFVLRDRRQLIYLKPMVVNNVSDAKKRCTKDLGGIRASCLLLGVRVCVCVVLLLTHMYTHRKGRLHQDGEVVNFKQENTPVWYSCLILKWNIQPKIFHPILKFWKPLRFDWEVQVSATYRALCCVHLSCLPKLHTLILTSTVVSQPWHYGHLGPSQSLLEVRWVGEAVLSIRGYLVGFLASTSRCTPLSESY